MKVTFTAITLRCTELVSWAEDRFGSLNQAYKFDGVNDYSIHQIINRISEFKITLHCHGWFKVDQDEESGSENRMEDGTKLQFDLLGCQTK